MAHIDVRNVAIRGISASIPRNKEQIVKIYEKWGGVESFIATTGVEHRRRAKSDLCSSDLCFHAAEKLIDELGWKKDEIEALVFVTQTPDYRLPATSCLLQHRLGLPQSCIAIDISLGCSGWVYGMSVISSLMQSGAVKKGLLLAGDTILKLCSSEDKSTYPLFGDAGSCTALEYDENDKNVMAFNLFTDGSGADTIITPCGGFRDMADCDSFETRHIENGIERNSTQLTMDGMTVFSFGISKAPKAVNQLLSWTGESVDDIDCFTFHQANRFMNEKIRKKLKLDENKVPYSMCEFGNTSCASIPLTLVSHRRDALREGTLKHVACGFGVGLSWGAVRFNSDAICVPELIEV